MNVASPNEALQPVSACRIRSKAFLIVSFFMMTPPGTKWNSLRRLVCPEADEDVLFRVFEDEVDRSGKTPWRTTRAKSSSLRNVELLMDLLVGRVAAGFNRALRFPAS